MNNSPYHEADLREYWGSFSFWFFRTSGFILLPLFIYVVVYLALGHTLWDLIIMPEWMIISIVLYGDSARKMIARDRAFKGFKYRLERTIAQALLGIVAASTLLIITLTAQLNYFEPTSLLPIGMSVIFALALLQSAYVYTRINAHTAVGEKLLSKKIELTDENAAAR